jgi:hypothetical protein
MDSPHSGSRSVHVELLRVETDLFDLYIQGRPFHPTVETLQLHRNGDVWVDTTVQISRGTVPIQMLNAMVYSAETGCLVPAEQAAIPPCFFETQTYTLVIQKKQDRDIRFHHENVLLRQAIKPIGRDQTILTGTLQFQNEVGFTDLEVRINGETALVIRIEIFPTKLDYKTDYLNILKEVNEQVYNLAFDFLRKTYQSAKLRNTSHQSLTEFFSILQGIFHQLVDAVERIQNSPHRQMISHPHLKEADRVKKVDRRNITYLSKRPHLFLRDDPNGIIEWNKQKYIPLKLLESHKTFHYDTSENRFLRWMLERVQTKLADIKSRIQSKDRTADPLLHRSIEHMQNQLRRLLKYDFLREVGKMQQMTISLVLQMAPGYRDVYRFYLVLMKGLSIQGDLTRLSLKDLAQLYEYWCFLKIHSLLKEKYELVRQNIIKVNRSGLFVTLDKSRKASVTYRNPRNGELFKLYYNSLPNDLSGHWPTLAQRPDHVLTLKKQESAVEYRYVFDAKYRLNPAYEGSYYYRSYGMPGPEEEDINTMHRYRDAIVYHEGTSGEYERSMFGAYVLFPYSDEEKFKEHRFYKSIHKVNVGAFPFLPGSTRLMEQFLDELIDDSPEQAFERSTKPRGTKEYYQSKLEGKNVLVGSLRSGQLGVCLEKRSYYMPLHLLMNEQHKVLPKLEFVALYQSIKQFGEEESGIWWVGTIEEWSVRKRKEITERPSRPGTEDELYVYFRIREWTKRKQPVKPGGRGVYTCLLTSKYILDRAQEIAELRLETEEQLKEWRQKRRQGKIRVDLDHENVDQAKRVLGIEVVT